VVLLWFAVGALLGSNTEKKKNKKEKKRRSFAHKCSCAFPTCFRIEINKRIGWHETVGHAASTRPPDLAPPTNIINDNNNNNKMMVLLRLTLSLLRSGFLGCVAWSDELGISTFPAVKN
jgi:hypothetical protein